MFRTVTAAIPVTLLVALAGCQAERELTSGPVSANAVDIQAACNSAPDICELIEALGPDPGLEQAMMTRFGNIARQLGRDQTADAVGKTFDLIVDVLTKNLDDPNGAAPPTEDEAKTELVNLLLEFVGLLPIFPEDGGLGDEDFAWQICEAGAKCVFETGSEFAGFSGTFTERTLVTISRLPDDPGPFEEFGFDDFPLFFDFSATSLSDAMGSTSAGLALASAPLAEPATVAVCVVDPPDPMAPPDPDVIALGHVIEGDEGPGVEILPDAPPGDFALDCEGASSTPPPDISSLRWWSDRVLAGLDPVSDFLASPLFANPGERRGLITAFSPVGAVDTTSGEEEGGPTTTTLKLNGQSTNVSILQGQTAIASAVVDPAPGNALEPSVQFIFSQFSGGPGPPTSTQFLDDGEASVPVLCDALGTLTPPAGTVEITASRFVRAEFPGAGEGDGEFEPSTSNTLILGCSAPIG